MKEWDNNSIYNGMEEWKEWDDKKGKIRGREKENEWENKGEW